MMSSSYDELPLIIGDPNPNPNPSQTTNPSKRKRNPPGAQDPESEVIALSPTSLMATNRFICEICKKGFKRDQNLQLHKRGHNLPWKLKQRSTGDDGQVVMRKKVYTCPESTCPHHNPARALGDLTGIKKHYSRKHGEKKYKCGRCCKIYAVQSDLKAHTKTCGTREYKCHCGTLFSRKDSFVTHRSFCNALAEESARSTFTTPMAIPSANMSFRSNEIMRNVVDEKNAHFSGVFRQEVGVGGGGIFECDDVQKSSRQLQLPLWVDDINANINNSHFINNIPAEFNVHHHHQNQQWLNRVVLKEEELENKEYNLGLQDVSSSLQYYINNINILNQHQQQQQEANSDVFGLVTTSFPNGSCMASTSAASTLTSNNGGGDHNTLLIDDTNSSPLLMGMGMPCDQSSSSHTRDFLGVNGVKENRDFLQEYASITNSHVMGMEQHYRPRINY